MIKAADMLIARRADTRARADFATWKMMAKLNGASALPQEAQTFLASYREMLKQMPEPEASEATIHLIYQAYYGELGGAGAAPDLPAQTAPVRPPTMSPPSSGRRRSRPGPRAADRTPNRSFRWR